MKKILWFILMLVTACAPFATIGGEHGADTRRFSIQYSKPWMKLNHRKHLVLTKDGPFSQYILVQQRPVDQPFKNTKRKLTKGMLPEEAARVILDEMASDRALTNFELLENHPVVVNHYDGFRIVFSYRTPDGISFKTIYCGLLKDEWFYSIRYNASEGHFSDTDVGTFEGILQSFEITEAEAA